MLLRATTPRLHLLLGLSACALAACAEGDDTGARGRTADSGLGLDRLEQGLDLELWAEVDPAVAAPPGALELGPSDEARPLRPGLTLCPGEGPQGQRRLRLRSLEAYDRLLDDPRVVDLRPVEGDAGPCDDDRVLGGGVGGSRPHAASAAPAGVSFTLNSGDAYAKSGSLLATLSASDDVAVTAMCFGTSSTACTSWKAYAESATITTTASGAVTLYAWFRDADGNVSAPLSDGIFIDKVRPTAGALTVEGSAGQLALSWSGFADAESGIKEYLLVQSSNTLTPPTKCSATAGTVVYQGADAAFTVTGLTDGTNYAYRLCAIDQAGNASTSVTGSGRPAPEYDDPTDGSVIINEDAAYTRSTRVNLTLAATDASAVAYMCVNATGLACTRWVTFATSTTATLASSTPGSQKIYAWFKDVYGNVTDEAVTDTITLDNVKPVNGTVSATPSAGQAALSWTGYSDAGSGIATYKVVQKTGATAPGTCMGTAVYQGADTSVTLTGLTDGTTYSYRVCALDNVGNLSSGSKVTTRPAPEFDAPTGTLSLRSGETYVGTAKVPFTIDATDVSGVAKYCATTAAKCTPKGTYTGTGSITVPRTTGTKKVNVFLSDIYNNVSATAISDTIIMDATKPTGGAATATVASGSEVDLVWSDFTDALSGMASYKVVYAIGSVAPLSCGAGKVGYTGTELEGRVSNLLPAKKYSFRVCGIDAVGNVSTGVTTSATTQAEATAPSGGSVEINGGDSVTTDPVLSLVLSAEDSSGVEEMCISHDASSTCTDWVNYDTAATYTLPSEDGAYTVNVWFKDTLGNRSAAVSADIDLDTTVPEDGELLLSQDSDTALTASWSGFTDATTDLSGYVLVYRDDGTEPVDCEDGTSAYIGSAESFSLTGLDLLGSYDLRVCAEDSAGNRSAGATAHIDLLDLESPYGGLVSISSGAVYTGETTVSLALSASDSVGVSEVCVSNSLGTCTDWQAMAATLSWDLDAVDGRNTVYAWFRDEAGNESAASKDDIILDLSAPTNGSATGVGSDGAVSLSWSGFSDARTSVASYLVVVETGSSAPADCSSGEEVYAGSATSTTVSGLDNGLTYSFRVCAVDAVGLVSSGAVVTGIRVAPEYDAPEETSISIDDDAEWTNSMDVALSLSATDASGVAEMCFSEDETACTDWMAYDTASTWTFDSTEGDRFVYAWFSDLYGSESSTPISDSIQLDLTSPTDGTLTVGQSDDNTISLSWTGFADALSGLDSYRVLYRADGEIPTDCNDGTVAYSGGDTSVQIADLTTNDAHGIRVCAYDVAGNESTGATAEYTLADTTAPTELSVVIDEDAVATNSTAVALTVDGDDATAIAEVCISTSSIACSTWVSQGATVPATLAATEGTQTLYVWARDPGGNTTSSPVSDDIIYDVTLPTDGVATASPASTEITLNMSGYADALSGIAGYQVVYNEGFTTPVDCDDGILGYDGDSSNPTVTGLTDGVSYTFRVCAVDYAGNVSAGDTVISRPGPEFDAPTAGAIVINGGDTATNAVDVTIAATADDASGLKDVCFSESSSACSAWQTWSTTNSFTLSSSEGEHTVYAWFRDYWNNETSSPVSATISLDTALPTDGTLSSITVTGDHTATAVVTGFGDAATGLSGYVAYASILSAPSACGSGTKVYDGVSSTLSITGLIGGRTNYIRICGVDAAGNFSAGITTSVTTTDTEAPYNGQISINAGAAATKSATVTVTVSASDDAGVTQMCVSATTTCTTWVTYAATRSLSLGSGTGTKTAYVKFRDAKLNVSSQSSDTIIVDTVKPVNGTLSATATSGTNSLSWTGFTDALSGIASYKVVYSTTSFPTACTAGTALYTGTGTSTTHTGVVKNKTYYYRVCAYDGAGNVSTGATKSLKAI